MSSDGRICGMSAPELMSPLQPNPERLRLEEIQL